MLLYNKYSHFNQKQYNMKKIFILLVVLIGISQALMAQGAKTQKVWNEDFKSTLIPQLFQ